MLNENDLAGFVCKLEYTNSNVCWSSPTEQDKLEVLYEIVFMFTGLTLISRQGSTLTLNMVIESDGIF